MIKDYCRISCLLVVSCLIMMTTCLVRHTGAVEAAQPEVTNKEVIDQEILKRKELEKEWHERREEFWGHLYKGILAEATEVRIYKTIFGVDLKMYVFRPKESKSVEASPAIIFFHGGGWGSGDPDELAPHCRYLASRGMVAMTAEYRIHDKRYTPIQALSNAKTAMRWARKNARELRIDPNRIAAGGSSAGGHLAAGLAALTGFDEPGEDLSVSARPDAMVLLSGVIDITENGWISGGKQVRALGMEPEAFSPFHHVKAGFPPTFYQYGEADGSVAPVAKRFEALMKKNGDVCQTCPDEKCGHGSELFDENSGTCFTDTMLKLDRFLVSRGFLAVGKPTMTLDGSVPMCDTPPPKTLADLSGFNPAGHWRIANGWHTFTFNQDGTVATPDGKTGNWRLVDNQLLYSWPDGAEMRLNVITPKEIEFPEMPPPSRNWIQILKKMPPAEAGFGSAGQ